MYVHLHYIKNEYRNKIGIDINGKYSTERLSFFSYKLTIGIDIMIKGLNVIFKSCKQENGFKYCYDHAELIVHILTF